MCEGYLHDGIEREETSFAYNTLQHNQRKHSRMMWGKISTFHSTPHLSYCTEHAKTFSCLCNRKRLLNRLWQQGFFTFLNEDFNGILLTGKILSFHHILYLYRNVCSKSTEHMFVVISSTYILSHDYKHMCENPWNVVLIVKKYMYNPHCTVSFIAVKIPFA